MRHCLVLVVVVLDWHTAAYVWQKVVYSSSMLWCFHVYCVWRANLTQMQGFSGNYNVLYAVWRVVYGISCFFPGMPFFQAVHILRRQDRIIKGVQVWYSDQVWKLPFWVLYFIQFTQNPWLCKLLNNHAFQFSSESCLGNCALLKQAFSMSCGITSMHCPVYCSCHRIHCWRTLWSTSLRTEYVSSLSHIHRDWKYAVMLFI